MYVRNKNIKDVYVYVDFRCIYNLKLVVQGGWHIDDNVNVVNKRAR